MGGGAIDKHNAVTRGAVARDRAPPPTRREALVRVTRYTANCAAVIGREGNFSGWILSAYSPDTELRLQSGAVWVLVMRIFQGLCVVVRAAVMAACSVLRDVYRGTCRLPRLTNGYLW